MNIIDITSNNPLSHSKVKINKNYVTVKTYLDVDHYASAIRTIANSCFTEEGYRPEFKEVAKRYVIVKYFTDIEIGDMSVEELFKVSQNDWYYTIENEVANLGIYVDMMNAVDEVIRYRLSTAKTSFDELCDEVREIAGRVDDRQSEDMNVMEKLLNKLSSVNNDTIAKAIVSKDNEEH